MRPRYRNGLIIGILAVIILGISINSGFDEAWQSQFGYTKQNETKYTDLNTELPVALPVFAEEEWVKPAAEQNYSPEQSTMKKLSNRTVEYHLSVKLRESDHYLEGQQTVTWTNPGKKPVTDLYFHLYPNAFYSAKSTFMKESGGKLRQDKATPNSHGYMELKRLQTQEGESLLPRLQYVQPDDGNKSDKTLVRLRLPEPVAAGKSVTLQLAFEVKLPEVFARMGYSGNFIMAGQWFPKIAAYETSGTRGRADEGWNLHQYHGNSEFYSNFGIFNVKIDVPENYKVAATGYQAKTTPLKNNRTEYYFYAEDVHDFAWSASPDFIYSEAPLSDEGIPGVLIKLYLDPSHEAHQERYIHAAKSSLSKLAKWYGAYPYSTLSIVVPPKKAGGAGGMEYPTLVTAFAADKSDPGYELERVVAHEIAHQYWYGMVANNEFEEAWLDEGLTSYSEDKIMEAVYGVTSNLLTEASYMTDPSPLAQPSWHFKNHRQYAENVYMRSKLLLLDLESKIGTAQMNKLLRVYFQTYKFKHPSTADFQRTVEKVTEQSWDNYFKSFIYSNKTADYEISDISVVKKKSGDKIAHESTVTINRSENNGAIPIVLKFQDGTIKTKIWNSEQTSVKFKEISDSPLLWAMIDPQQSNMLDNQLINNYMIAELDSQKRARWNIGTTSIIEGLLKMLAW